MIKDALRSIAAMAIAFVLKHFGDLALIGGGMLLGAWLF